MKKVKFSALSIEEIQLLPLLNQLLLLAVNTYTTSLRDYFLYASDTVIRVGAQPGVIAGI